MLKNGNHRHLHLYWVIICWWRVLLQCWWLLTDQCGGCWRLGWPWQFLKIRQRKFGSTLKSESCSVESDCLQFHVHGILQAKILEWVAYPFFSRSSQPRNQTGVSCIAGGFFTNWAIREAHEFCVDLYIFFCWSGPPVCSQWAFCMHFCVWRCVPDLSVERDILHIHLLFRHLVLYLKWIFERSVFSCLWPTFSSSYSYCWHSA